MSTDRRIAVVGTGTTGAMTLWQLARRGIEPVGFDRYAPGHDRGAGAGESRIFRTAYREGAEYVPLLQRARELWRELESESARSLLTLSGGLTIGPVDHPDIRMVIACAEEFGLEYEVLPPADAERRFPEHPVRDGEVAVLDHSAGVLRPEPAVLAAATEAERHGATIHRYDPVEQITPEPGGVVVRSRSGEHRFDQVVLAPGPWVRDQPLLDFVPFEVHQITTCWFPLVDPDGYPADERPIVIRVGDTAYSCFPAVDGVSVKLSIRHIERPRIASAEDLPRAAPSDLFDAARMVAAELLPAVHPEPIRVGTYADAFSPDRHGVVGRLPGHDNVTILAGFSGHGFKYSPVVGEAAADLVIDGTTQRGIAHLDPARFGAAMPS